MDNTGPGQEASHENIIRQTQRWIQDIVIGLNLCPFAARPFNKGSIHFHVCPGADKETHLQQFADQLYYLEQHEQAETALIIFPDDYHHFHHYLDLLDMAERLLDDLGFHGRFQLASFHPYYVFADSEEADAANFSNRSPWPMLHVLRESSISQAVASHPDVSSIPRDNIRKLRELAAQKGCDFLVRKRDGQ